MPHNTKVEFHDLMTLVRDGKLSVDEADIHARTIFTNAIGEQETVRGSRSGFPDRWITAPVTTKQTWVNARNHLRRGIIARYDS